MGKGGRVKDGKKGKGYGGRRGWLSVGKKEGGLWVGKWRIKGGKKGRVMGGKKGRVMSGKNGRVIGRKIGEG